jgi:hypothetical protein
MSVGLGHMGIIDNLCRKGLGGMMGTEASRDWAEEKVEDEKVEEVHT